MNDEKRATAEGGPLDGMVRHELAYYAQYTMTPGTPMQQAAAAAVEEIERLRSENKAWRKQANDLTHQVICCGVAASHPDATLTTRGAYAGKWNSAQAEQVRALRRDRDRLTALKD